MTETEQMIEDCEIRESKMSEWEIGFIDSISQQIAYGRSLTEKQNDILEKIWERIT